MDHRFVSSPSHRLCGMGEHLLALVCESAPREQLSAWLRVPLEHAAAKGDLDCVTRLMAEGADAYVRRCPVSDRSPLVAACRGGNGAVVAVLLETGGVAADGEALDEQVTPPSDSFTKDTWSTPLHLAASGGHVAAVRALVRAGADKDAPDEAGCSALHLAVFRGSTVSTEKREKFEEIVNVLAVAGATVDTSDDEGETPLHTASGHGNLAMVRSILRSRPNNVVSENGDDVHLHMSPLHRAALGGHCKVMRELLDHGSNLASLAGNGRTALHAAAMSGSADAVRFLLARDIASLEAADLEGCSALHLAAGHRLGSDGTLTALLVAGANIEAQTFLGETALHKACKALRVSAVRVLLRWGANEAAVDAGGQTPAAMASHLLKSQSPGVFRDMLEDILDMLANAPADRSWRRRGWLLLLRARQGFRRGGVFVNGRGGDDNPSGGGGWESVGCRQKQQQQPRSSSSKTRSSGILERPGDGVDIGKGAGGYDYCSEGRPSKMGKGGTDDRSSVAMVVQPTYGVAGMAAQSPALSLGRGGLAGRAGYLEEPGADGAEAECFSSTVERAVGVHEDGIFRRIIGFL